MAGRPPWLKARANLISLAAIDSLTIYGVYNIAFHEISSRWAGITGSVTTAIFGWLGISYLLGRYSFDKNLRRTPGIKILRDSGLTGLIVIMITILGTWMARHTDVRIEKSFLLPVALSTVFISSVFQLVIRRRHERQRRWIIIGTKNELEIIKQELDLCTAIKNIDTILISDGQRANIYEKYLTDGCGIAISDKALLRDEIVEDLLLKRSKGFEIQDLVSWCEQNLQRVPPEMFSERWLVQADGFKLKPSRHEWRIKRLGDLTLGSILLTLTLPITVAAALAIKIEDGGPIFYEQMRTGLYEETYRVWKLRTMKVGAEKKGPQWAVKNDHRITKVGAWLRKFRVDELPQLISVIKGEMSLIGPRPERPEIEHELEKIIPHYRIRHWVRPGLSGWAQVCYRYGSSIADSRAKLSYDLYYIRNASIMLDLLIMAQTIRMVILAKGSLPYK